MVPSFTEGVDAARAQARVGALVVDAGQEVGTICITLAFPVASQFRVARVAGLADALEAVVDLGDAVGVPPAWVP